MRTRRALAVVGSAVAIGATALLPFGATAQDPVTLTIMHNWGESDAKGPAMEAFIAACEAAHPGLTIQTEVYTDADIPTKVETSFIAGQEPDLVFQNFGARTATWLDKGIVVPVEQYLADWGLGDAFREDALGQYTNADGNLLAFPLEGFTWPIWYNTAILEEAGVAIPTTVDELIAAAPKIREAGYQPFAMGGGDWPAVGFASMMSLGYMTDEQGRQLWGQGGFESSPEFAAFVNDLVAMRDAGVFNDGAEGYNYDQMNQLYFDGKAAMMHGGSWSFGNAPEEIQAVTTIGGLPLGADTVRTKPISESGFQGKGVWVTRNGAAKLDIVKDCITALYSQEVQKGFVEDAAMLSPLKSVDVDEASLNPLFLQSMTLNDTTDGVELMDAYRPQGVDETVYNLPFLPGTSASDVIAAFQTAYQQ